MKRIKKTIYETYTEEMSTDIFPYTNIHLNATWHASCHSNPQASLTTAFTTPCTTKSSSKVKIPKPPQNPP